MSEILSVVARAGIRSACPILRVKCSHCGRRYQTAQWPDQIRKRERCKVCVERPNLRRVS